MYTVNIFRSTEMVLLKSKFLFICASMKYESLLFSTICNGNRTEWSRIRSVILRVITKSDDRVAGVRFVNHEYDYRRNWTTRSLVTN